MVYLYTKRKSGISLPYAISRNFDKNWLNLLWKVEAISLISDSCKIFSGILGGFLKKI